MQTLRCPHCHQPLQLELFTSYLGRLGKGCTSAAKKKSSRANGRKGGRPKKKK